MLIIVRSIAFEIIGAHWSGPRFFGLTKTRASTTPSLAFLDPVLINAACSGDLPRRYGVSRLMDLPSRFADQWRARPTLGAW